MVLPNVAKDATLAARLSDHLVEPDEALGVPPAADRSVWDPVGGSVDPATAADLLARATADLGRPWPVPLASQAAGVHRDGDRDGWEQQRFSHRDRLSRAAVAAALTRTAEWLDQVADGVVLLCEQTSWCWPAHDDGWQRRGWVLADPDRPYLDLGAGEVIGQLAWVDHLLGPDLDQRFPGLRVRIRREARQRVFGPFLGRRDWHWLGLDGDVHNWNPWIHGNILAAALRLLDGPDEEVERVAVIASAVGGIDRYLAALPADGSIDEGIDYWWNGACRAMEALDLVCSATAGRLDLLTDVPLFAQLVAFPHRMHLGGDFYVNIADSQARQPADQPWHVVHRLAHRIGAPEAAVHAAAHRRPGRAVAHERHGLQRLLLAMTDREWRSARPGPSPLPSHTWLSGTQMLVARERAGASDGLAVAAKGGTNGEHHNHNDVGSFILASDGVPVLVDAGRPTYTARTFSAERYSLWMMQSAWHNLPTVRGIEQAPGPEFRATGVIGRLDRGVSELSLDIARAYPLADLRNWRRRIRLERDRRRVTIDDAWELGGEGPGAAPTTIHLIVAGRIDRVVGGLRVTPLTGATPVLLRVPEDCDVTLTEKDLGDAMLSQVWGDRLTRVGIDVSARRSCMITATQLPGGNRPPGDGAPRRAAPAGSGEEDG